VRGGHRFVWYALLGPGLALFVGLLLLRSTAEDPVRNLAISQAACLALAPPDVPSEQNAATDYKAAQAAKVAWVSPTTSSKYPSDHPEMMLSRDSRYLDEPAVQQYFKANDNAAKLLRAGAAKERCNWGLNYAGGNGMRMPHLVQLRDSARLLAGHARASAHSGDHQTAVEDIQALYAMARHLEADPVLICGLVSVAISAIADEVVEAIVNYDTPVKLEDVQAYRSVVWLDRRPRDHCVRYMAGEKASGLYTMDSLFANPSGPMAGTLGVGPTFPASGGLPFYGGERRCYVAVMDEMAARFQRGESIDDTAIMALIDSRQEGTGIFVRLVVPVLDRVNIAFCRGAEKARVVDAGLAVLAYRLKHGRDPKTLEELVPEFMPSGVPHGVFHDQPLRLRVDPEGVVESDRPAHKTFRRDRGVLRIYTVGENGVDDGGLNDWQGILPGTGKDDQFFCVPPIVRTPREEWKKK